jgi:hypothetical protein
MEDVLIYRYIQYILFGYMSHILVYDIYEFNVLNLKGWFFLIPSIAADGRRNCPGLRRWSSLFFGGEKVGELMGQPWLKLV